MLSSNNTEWLQFQEFWNMWCEFSLRMRDSLVTCIGEQLHVFYSYAHGLWLLPKSFLLKPLWVSHCSIHKVSKLVQNRTAQNSRPRNSVAVGRKLRGLRRMTWPQGPLMEPLRWMSRCLGKMVTLIFRIVFFWLHRFSDCRTETRLLAGTKQDIAREKLRWGQVSGWQIFIWPPPLRQT